MNRMKRIIALVLCLVLVGPCSVDLFAYATETDTQVEVQSCAECGQAEGHAEGCSYAPAAVADPCATCGKTDCTSSHENWCTHCKQDDCGKTHIVCTECGTVDGHTDTCSANAPAPAADPCATCGKIDCTSSHENWCAHCKQDDCGKTHVTCEECAAVDGHTDSCSKAAPAPEAEEKNPEKSLAEQLISAESIEQMYNLIQDAQENKPDTLQALTKYEINAVFERVDALDPNGFDPLTEKIVDVLISLPNFMTGAEEDGEEHGEYDLLDDHSFTSDTTIDNAITIKYVDGNDANWQIKNNITITINDTITVPDKTYLDILCTEENITATIKAGSKLGSKPMFVVQKGGILKIAKTTGESGAVNKGQINLNGVTIQVEAGGKVYIEKVNEIKGTCSWMLNGGEVQLFGTMPITSGSLSITGSGTVKRNTHDKNTGYMFTVAPSATLTVDGSDDSAYQNNWSSGVVIIDGGSMENVKSAIYCRGKFNLRDAVVKNNFANIDGGAISLGLSNQTSTDSVTVEITRALIENCTTTVDGGGIKLNGYTGGVITMTDSTVRNCSGRGGAIRTNGAGNAKMNITRCLLEGNHGTDHGGGVYWNANGTKAYLTITDSVIKGNTAKLKGGGLFLEGSNMSLTSTDIIGNSAQNGGGVSVNAYGGGMGVGMEATDSFNLAIGNGVTIKDNVATDNGGGIAMTVFSADPADGYTYNISIEDGAVIENNKAGGNGGAIYAKLEYNDTKKNEYNLNLQINGGRVQGNEAGGNGGAFYLERTYGTTSKKTFEVNMAGGTVISNKAKGNYGGAVYIKNGKFNMSGGSMQTNSAAMDGGAVYVASGDVMITSGTFSGNSAVNQGGAVCINGGNATITSGTITGNSAKNGAAFAISNGYAIVGLEECKGKDSKPDGHTCPIITNNTAQVYGGAFYVTGGTTHMYCGDLQRNTAIGEPKSSSYYQNGGTFEIWGGNLDQVHKQGGDYIDHRDAVIFARFYKNRNDINPVVVQTVQNSTLTFPSQTLHSDFQIEDKTLFSWTEINDSVTIGTYLVGETKNTVASSGNYYANWVDNTYSITYELNGTANNPITYEGTNPATYDFSADASVISLEAPKRSGYVFTGWTLTSADSNSNWGTITEPQLSFQKQNKYGNIVLSANWVDADNSISYELNGGAFESGVTPLTVFSQAQLPYTLPNPVKTGFVFSGWTGNGTTTPNTALKIESGTTGTLEFTANWTHIEYTLTLDANEGTVAQSEIKYFIDQPVQLPTPTRPGYTFDGWKPKTSIGNWNLADQYVGELTGKYGDNETGALELIAQWTQNEVTITYVATVGGTVDPTSQTVGQATGTPSATATPAAGYEFEGWYQGNTLITKELTFSPEKVDNLNVEATYTAKFKLALVDVTITVNTDIPVEVTLIGTPKDAKYNGKQISVDLVFTADKKTIVVESLPVGDYKVIINSDLAWRHTPAEATVAVDGVDDTVELNLGARNAFIYWLNGYSYKKGG